MSFKVSTGLRNYMLDTGSFKAGMDAGFLEIYKGTEPATADDAIGSGILLVQISLDGLGVTGLTFDSPAVAGVIAKAAAEAWQGTCVDSGTATFFRFLLSTDTAVLSTSELRCQGTVGLVGAELNLSNTALVNLAPQTINHFNVALPTL